MPEPTDPNDILRTQEKMEKSAELVAKHFKEISDESEKTKDNLEETVVHESKIEKFSKSINRHQKLINTALVGALGILGAMGMEYNSMVKAISTTADQIGVIDKRLQGWQKSSRYIAA